MTADRPRGDYPDACPVCGGSGGGADPAGWCRHCDGTGQYPPSVFTHCNVCGRSLYHRDEDMMGMCRGCAAE